MFPAFFLAALAFAAPDAQFAFETADGLVRTCTPRDAGSEGGHRAADFLYKAARNAGADVRKDVFRAPTPDGERTFVNLRAEFRSAETNAPWVIFVSHFDTKPGCGCPGANDGAATSGLLVALARALAGRKDLKCHVMLLWTDGEECMRKYGENDGFWGSRRAAAQVAARKLNVRAVVCLDMLGDRDLRITLPANGTPELVRTVLQAARRVGHQDLVRPAAMWVKDDHVAFLDRGYPAVDLIDFSYGPDNAYWHTPQDTMDKVSESSLLKVGQIAAELLNILL